MKNNLESGVRRSFFEMGKESRAFYQAFTEFLGTLTRAIMNQHLSEENTLRYNHGQRWSYRANEHASDGDFTKHSTQSEVKFDDIIEGNPHTLVRNIQEIVKDFERQMMTSVYAKISEVCDENGNTVSAKEMGFPAAFMEMLRKIEFGVDRSGQVSLPAMHVGFDSAKMIAQLEEQPPEYHQEIERIKAEKTQLALEKERIRKSKFKKSES